MSYSVAKARGQWWIIDRDGFEVSYVGYDTKKEALNAAKVREQEDSGEVMSFKHNTIVKIMTECRLVVMKGETIVNRYDDDESQEKFRQALRELVMRLESELDASYFNN